MKYYKDRYRDIWLEKDGEFTIIFSPNGNKWLGGSFSLGQQEFWELKEITEEQAFLESI